MPEQLTDEEPRPQLVNTLSSPKAWPPGSSCSVGKMSAFTWGSQMAGQETVSALSKLEEIPQKSPPLQGQVTFPRSLPIPRQPQPLWCMNLPTLIRCCLQNAFSKGSHHLPNDLTVPWAAISISVSRHRAVACMPTLSGQACGWHCPGGLGEPD